MQLYHRFIPYRASWVKGAHLRCLAPECHTSRLQRWQAHGIFWLALDLNPKPPAPVADVLALVPSGRSRDEYTWSVYWLNDIAFKNIFRGSKHCQQLLTIVLPACFLQLINRCYSYFTTCNNRNQVHFDNLKLS